MGKSYTVKVGGKTYSIALPKFLSGDKKSTTEHTPVSIGHGVKAKTNRKNQLDEIERQLNDVGKSDMEKEVFDD